MKPVRFTQGTAVHPFLTHYVSMLRLIGPVLMWRDFCLQRAFAVAGGAARGCSHLVFEHGHAVLPGVGAPSSPQHCGGEGGPLWLLSRLMEVEVCLTQGLRSAKSQFHRGAKPPSSPSGSTLSLILFLLLLLLRVPLPLLYPSSSWELAHA